MDHIHEATDIDQTREFVPESHTTHHKTAFHRHPRNVKLYPQLTLTVTLEASNLEYSEEYNQSAACAACSPIDHLALFG